MEAVFFDLDRAGLEAVTASAREAPTIPVGCVAADSVVGNWVDTHYAEVLALMEPSRRWVEVDGEIAMYSGVCSAAQSSIEGWCGGLTCCGWLTSFVVFIVEPGLISTGNYPMMLELGH